MKITARYLSLLLVAGLLSVGGMADGYAAPFANPDRPSIAPMLEKVTPSVVNIAVSGHVQVQNPVLENPLLRRFFDVPDEQQQPQSRETRGLGSGVIIDADNGYVITNHHVVNQAEMIKVILQDKREVNAKVIGSDPGTDIALIQIDADNLKALPIGNSDTLRVGDYVAAIGDPFGIGQTVTTGIVSALSRETGINGDGFEDFIQTDASINPGNSGGALVDYNGEPMGINSSIISPAGGNVGIGFAVPINMAMAVVDQLIDYGEVHRGLLGVLIQDLTPDVVDALNLDVGAGAVVSRVEPDSPAEGAGIQAGDVIVSVDDDMIAGANDLRNTIGLTRAGETVTIGLVRDNKRQEVSVTIGSAPGVADSGAKASTSSVMEGAELSNIPPDNDAYGVDQGVLVTTVTEGSRAYRNGLQAGDIITAVNRHPVASRSELESYLADNAGTVALNVRRGDQLLFLIMR